MEDFILLVGAICVGWLLFKIIFGSLKKIIGLVINGVLGVILLTIFNYFGALFGITIGINLLTALIAGILGVPGVILMVLFQLF
ncbi:pro-sigmaK processing inhibitor BofA family protein [Clostridium massiliamazoniense]|uniref:pro-sigmaK processing inhibitor BofA family protein n=1 Tax=Clostridium massiliamazoniense TaxID=1347366 RepID=UPI0006D82A21|nr:pro-sigmaK processing inhibitor BofA family protein [Clostridium massiliamazoniense]